MFKNYNIPYILGYHYYEEQNMYWLDDDTFLYWFGNYEDFDTGDDYNVVIEYHIDEDKLVFEKSLTDKDGDDYSESMTVSELVYKQVYNAIIEMIRLQGYFRQ